MGVLDVLILEDDLKAVWTQAVWTHTFKQSIHAIPERDVAGSQAVARVETAGWVGS